MFKMQKPVVIVDPISSGKELAPAFKKRGIPAIAVTLNSPSWSGFGTEINYNDFIEVLPNQADLIQQLKKHDPLCVIPGNEVGVQLAEELTWSLTPQFANDPEKSLHRYHKYFMQQALHERGIPALNTKNTANEDEAEKWLHKTNLINHSFIIKPPASAGSDKVFHIQQGEDWRVAFRRVLAEPNQSTGEKNNTVILQEEAIGTEFAVGTISSAGQHYLSHLIEYSKIKVGDRKTIYDHVEFVNFNEKNHGEIFRYAKKVLTALGMRYGASHIEIMLTNKGPRLIEIAPRMCGGPVMEFSRAATGSCQADKLVEIYIDGDVKLKDYIFKQTVMPVFLKSPVQGIVKNAEIFSAIATLPTLLNQFLWFKNGEAVPKTVDYLTSIGIIALAGEKKQILQDYAVIREIEARLQVDALSEVEKMMS